MEGIFLKILESSQEGSVNHMKNIKLLQKVYNSSDYEQFLQYFLRALHRIVQEDFQNPNCQHVLNFLAKFVGHIASSENTEDSNSSETKSSGHLFLNAVVEGIIPYHGAPAQEIRYNVCSFLSLVLQNLGEQFVVDNHIIDLILDAMLENIQGSKPLVRLQAVKALTRLQEPPNRECPVIQAYINCLRDSSHLVRREAVKRIAPNAITIPMLKEKTRDRDANVRGAAFTHLADIGVKHLKIVHRQFILKSGFSETVPHVKKIFLEYLLPKWLSALNGSYLAFLNAIKLDAEETDIIKSERLSTQIMQVFFKTEPISDLIDALPLDETKLIPENSIRSELAHYWNILVKYLRQSEDLEEYLDKIIPELTIFCNYIDRLVSNKFSKPMEDWEYLDFQYMLYHLFDMAENYDLSEEVGRRTLDKLVKKVLRNHRLQPRLLNKIIQTGSKLALDTDSFTTEICLIISDIWQPLTNQPAAEEHNTLEENFRHFTKSLSRIAQVKVKLNILQGDLEDAVFNLDFEKAHQLKLNIKECEKKLEEMTVVTAPVEQVRVALEDPETLCWCLDLLAALLIHGNIKTLSPSLVTCRKEFLMPLIASKNVEIGWRAFKCLTVYSIFDKKLAEDQLKTLCIPISSYRIIPNFNKEILIDSVGVISDLVLLHGTDVFTTEGVANSTTLLPQNSTKRRLYNEEDEEVDYINNPLSVDFIVSVLLDMLDDENDDIREKAVTAIAKLMLNGFPVNSMVVTRLILKWYNPSTQRSLQQKLGTVIKCYTENVANAKEIVVKSIVPILTNIAEAPRTSPLAEVDIDNAVRFLAAISDSEHRVGFVHVHMELGRILLNEISLRPSESATIYFCKMLNLLRIIPDNSPAVKELITLAVLILEKESLDKLPKHHVSKFIGKLNGHTPCSTLTTVNNTTNTSGNVTSDQSSKQIDSRRLSAVIEEDKSNDETETAKEGQPNEGSNESCDPVPVKKRIIDNNVASEKEVSVVDNAASNGDQAESNNSVATGGKEMLPAVAQSSMESNIQAASKTTNANGVSSSSESEVIPSSQADPEVMLSKTKNRLNLRAQVTEKVTGSRPTVVASQKSTRSKTHNVASAASSEQTDSASSKTSTSQESARKTRKGNSKKNKTASSDTARRDMMKSVGKNPSESSSKSGTPSFDTAEASQNSRRSTAASTISSKINERITRSVAKRRESNSGNKRGNVRNAARRDVMKSVGKYPSESSSKSDTSSLDTAEASESSPTRSAASSRRSSAASSISSEINGRITRSVAKPRESNSGKKRGNARNAARRDVMKSVGKYPSESSSKSDTSSLDTAEASESSPTRSAASSRRSSAASSISSKTNERITRSVAKRQEPNSKNKRGNARKNGVRKPAEKENNIRPPPAKRGRLDFDSPSKNLREKHENNILQGKELFIKINGSTKLSSKFLKTPQVKRRKSRNIRNRMEQIEDDGIMNASDSSVDQTLHTIVHPPDFEISLLEEDSPQNTPNSSRRLRVVLSETSSDESSAVSIRKSKRRTMNKSKQGFI